MPKSTMKIGISAGHGDVAHELGEGWSSPSNDLERPHQNPERDAARPQRARSPAVTRMKLVFTSSHRLSSPSRASAAFHTAPGVGRNTGLTKSLSRRHAQSSPTDGEARRGERAVAPGGDVPAELEPPRARAQARRRSRRQRAVAGLRVRRGSGGLPQRDRVWGSPPAGPACGGLRVPRASYSVVRTKARAARVRAGRSAPSTRYVYRTRRAAAPVHSDKQRTGRDTLQARARDSAGSDAVPAPERADGRVEAAVTQPRRDLLLPDVGASQEPLGLHRGYTPRTGSRKRCPPR